MKWTPDDHGCIYDEAGCFARLTPNKAGRLASRHNADIDALTAERDELQRRLDAVVTSLKPDGPPTQPCRFSDWCAISDQIKLLTPLHARALAIAEGREG